MCVIIMSSSKKSNEKQSKKKREKMTPGRLRARFAWLGKASEKVQFEPKSK